MFTYDPLQVFVLGVRLSSFFCLWVCSSSFAIYWNDQLPFSHWIAYTFVRKSSGRVHVGLFLDFLPHSLAFICLHLCCSLTVSSQLGSVIPPTVFLLFFPLSLHINFRISLSVGTASPTEMLVGIVFTHWLIWGDERGIFGMSPVQTLPLNAHFSQGTLPSAQ